MLITMVKRLILVLKFVTGGALGRIGTGNINFKNILFKNISVVSLSENS